jgi:hypothetical protein
VEVAVADLPQDRPPGKLVEHPHTSPPAGAPGSRLDAQREGHANPVHA